MNVRLLVSCATGIATSVLAASRLKTLLKERGIDAETLECKAAEVASRSQNYQPDAIVSTTPVPGNTQFKVFGGVPLLTGVGASVLADEIAAYLRERAGA